ncbi:hypothetical protein GNX18_00610 [Microbulbifer sp. SH-1]|uniref:hypothetical protein n=1 Tax=Microbulbifer sp. SH-1 TaxID=2681547 RepID=UPI00140BED3C|nr:hypothetical protein [Microbulbifer sp. SH-1]QIL88436.1 hypothetical protein GNX18_00610 [Microbulbifer sp. SH-1]
MWLGNEQNPKGPSWRRARSVRKNVSGTQIRLQAPPVRPNKSTLRAWYLETEPDHFDLASTDTLEPIDYQSVKPAGSERADRRVTIWSSGWSFSGRPLLDGGSLGELRVNLVVEEVGDLPVNCSLFRREDLLRYARGYFSEGWLGSYHEGYGEEQDTFDITEYHWPCFLAPLNAQWLERNDQYWLYFEAQPLRIGPDEFYWLYPIGHRRCLRVSFAVSRWLSNAGNPYRKQRSPLTNYLRLMENIMSTIVVELSESAAREKASIHNSGDHFPLFHCSEAQVNDAKHTLYMWSGAEYRDKSQPKEGGDHRAPKEDVAAFIDERIKPRPLPGCLAIGPAFIENDNFGELGSEAAVEIATPLARAGNQH